jgi:NaMN:DMB phosphoribosyltransferase
MEALGIAALGKISGSMPGNNQNLKQELVCRAMREKDLKRGSALNDPLSAVQLLGDPMQAVQAGIAMSASRKVPVLLAGGTQMIAVAALIGALLNQPAALQAITLRSSKELINNALEAQLKNIAIATTAWVSEDKSADLRSLMQQLPRPLPLYSVRLDFSTSRYKNLQLYEEGYVKEGVGAGALALSVMLYQDLDNLKFLPMIEKVYEEIYLD